MAYCNGMGFCVKRNGAGDIDTCDGAGDCVKGFASAPHVRDEIDNAKNYPRVVECGKLMGYGRHGCTLEKGHEGEHKTRVEWLTDNVPPHVHVLAARMGGEFVPHTPLSEKTGSFSKAEEIRRLNVHHPDLPAWEKAQNRQCFYGLGETCRCQLPDGHEGEHVMRRNITMTGHDPVPGSIEILPDPEFSSGELRAFGWFCYAAGGACGILVGAVLGWLFS